MIPLLRMPSSEIPCLSLGRMLSLMPSYLPTYLISLETTLPINLQKNHLHFDFGTHPSSEFFTHRFCFFSITAWRRLGKFPAYLDIHQTRDRLPIGVPNHNVLNNVLDKETIRHSHTQTHLLEDLCGWFLMFLKGWLIWYFNDFHHFHSEILPPSMEVTFILL